MSDGQLLALTEEIYDTAAGGTPWAAVGKSLSRLVGASNGWLCVSDHKGDGAELLYRADYPDKEIAAYQTYYRYVDLWTIRTADAVLRADPNAPPKARTSGHLVPDTEYIRSEFYADLGRHVGLRHVVGTVVPLGAAGLMPVCLHRADGEAPFEHADAHLLDRLLPHLRRAMQLRHQLNPGTSSVSPGTAALDALATAVVVVDAELRIVLANAAAEAIAADRLGLQILAQRVGPGPRHRILAALQHEDQRALGALVQATAMGGSPGGGLRVRDASLAPALAVLVSPLPRRLSDGAGGLTGRVPGQALILLRDLRAALRAPDPSLLRRLFMLTPAEAEVACALYGGATKSAVAAMRGLKESTIKSQVDSILLKTGTANLRDLERLLASLR
jgi:DNA-binding CsgD family transcriptional regulator/PAS domain-containing protein